MTEKGKDWHIELINLILKILVLIRRKPVNCLVQTFSWARDFGPDPFE